MTADRSLPLIYVPRLASRPASTSQCDLDLGVTVRRAKDAEEVEHLRESQRVTEQAIEMACTLIARAKADRQGCAAAGTAHR